ncbi:hypothetical protein D3C87_1499510 [compost metagenome]
MLSSVSLGMTVARCSNVLIVSLSDVFSSESFLISSNKGLVSIISSPDIHPFKSRLVAKSERLSCTQSLMSLMSSKNDEILVSTFFRKSLSSFGFSVSRNLVPLLLIFCSSEFSSITTENIGLFCETA